MQVGGAIVAQSAKKSKKKPSFLKKRILQERYRVYQEQQSSNQIENITATEEHNSCKYSLAVFGLSDGIDLSDTDELVELSSNIKELFSPFTELRTITILQQSDHFFPSPYTTCVILEYSDEQSAKDALTFMNGRMVGGEEILVFLVPSVGQQPVMESAQFQTIPTPDVVPTALLSLENVFSVEDIMEGDQDSLKETCRDILSLCQPFPGAINISYTAKNKFPSLSQSITVEIFRKLLISQWESKILAAGSNKDIPRVKLTTSQKNHLKSMKKFHKPLLGVSFQETIVNNADYASSWSVWQASPWIALCITRITHGLFIGGEEVCVHCLLTPTESLNKEPFLLNTFPDRDASSSTETANMEHKQGLLSVWEMQVLVSESNVDAVQSVLAQQSHNISFLSSERTPDTSAHLFKVHTQAASNMIQLWQQMVQSTHLLQELFIVYHQPNGDAYTFYHGSSSTHRSLPYPSCSIALLLENFITTEDMHEYLVSNASHEELTMAKQDLLQIWQNQSATAFDTLLHGQDVFEYLVSYVSQLTILPFHLTTKHITKQTESQVPTLSEEQEQEQDTIEDDVSRLDCDTNVSAHCDKKETVTVEVTYGHRWQALQAMCYFDGLVLGGEPIAARVTSFETVSQPTTTQDNTDHNHHHAPQTGPDTPIESSVTHQLQEWVTTHARLTMTEQGVTHCRQVYREELASDVSPPPLTTTTNQTMIIVTKDDPEGDDLAMFASQTNGHATQGLKARKISLYRIAKHVPHLSSHKHSSHNNHVPSSPAVSPPLLPIATEEINTYMKEFLRLLSEYQRHLRDKLLSERPPFPVYPDNSPKLATLKAKQLQTQALAEFREGQLRKFKLKLRYVCGLKQSLQALKSGRVKLIVLAPNTESAMALDHKVAQLLHVAEALEVPVLYALSRRLLGKALQMSMKQSCVAVLSAEGRQDSYELFRKISTFAKANK